VVDHGSHALLVVCESLNSFTLANVPESNHFVVRARDELRLIVLENDRLDDVGVARETCHLDLGSHVPQSNG